MGRPALKVLAGSGGADERRETLRRLYATYGGTVYERCRYLLKDRTRAEDAMQEVFAKALTHLPEFRAEASPLTWLVKISTHHCLNLLRAERASWRRLFAQRERARPDSAGGPQLLEMRDAVLKLLGRL